ncbi:universal stress protein [Flagellimonas sp.]|jgi:nucleotide-binding universal stress UspA family protein|uniref:universal stress protein n=1 Tax=Flagellimonas sp. TaxID=2058762 RepID=UPI003BAA805A|tara:strand:- start:845 stop:1288 length:444 start_codon:yes stop_codon:yes gene_type:complete
MGIIKKILVAIDGSDSALNAANYAVELANQVHAQLEIVYVVRYSPGKIDAGIFPADIQSEEKENAIQLINKIRQEHPEVKIQDFETLGRPAEEINKTIQNWNANLLIIGHHAHRFFTHLLKNSIEKKLLKHLKVPLLIIPENYTIEP